MEQKLYDLLKELNIEFEKFEHEPFFTCEESNEFYQKQKGKGGHFKTLFLRNKPKTRWVLAIVESHRKADLKALQNFLEESKNFSFGAPEYLKEKLGLTPGSVTPFGLIHPNAGDLEVVVDEGLLEHDFVHFHPLRNTATLRLSKENFLKFLESRGNTIRFYPF
ncbi:prolyl-tRNA synthetase associated domain-containing protein [Candidatus Gracilibacteria bacterium]|nr:prolyl-tRNA synthetase associated domain-containing protein [Candidatus Gracilibacteria bacterium]